MKLEQVSEPTWNEREFLSNMFKSANDILVQNEGVCPSNEDTLLHLMEDEEAERLDEQVARVLEENPLSQEDYELLR